MNLDKILRIALNIKRIKNLTDNEHIIEAVDNISDIIQEEINLKGENKDESSNSTQ